MRRTALLITLLLVSGLAWGQHVTPTPAVPSTANITQVGGNVVTTGAGVVAAGSPRVTLGSNDPAVVALEIMDDWDDGGNRANANATLQVADVDVSEANPAPTKQVDLDTPAHAELACDDTGAIAYASDAADVEVWVSNNSLANDVCIRFGTAGVPDRTSPQTCDLILGPYAGAGEKLVVALPIGFIGSFECDAAAASVLTVTSARRNT